MLLCSESFNSFLIVEITGSLLEYSWSVFWQDVMSCGCIVLAGKSTHRLTHVSIVTLFLIFVTVL